MRCPRRIAAPPIRAHSVQRVRNSNDARHQRNLRTLQAVGIAATIHVFVAQLDARQHVLKLRNGAHDIGALYGVLLHQAELFPELARRGVVPFFRLYPHTRQTIGGVVSFGKNSATPLGSRVSPAYHGQVTPRVGRYQIRASSVSIGNRISGAQTGSFQVSNRFRKGLQIPWCL